MIVPAQKITPFLMFTGAAEEAMTFYTSLFDDSEILETDEQERLWKALAHGGAPLMPLGDYGFGPFGWTNDGFGVSWQLAMA
jgi:predicted 3-demethylubiquinone-9 3-methyltransferase (glyoxalase superfamily)